jgi:hypothetical protein
MPRMTAGTSSETSISMSSDVFEREASVSQISGAIDRAPERRGFQPAANPGTPLEVANWEVINLALNVILGRSRLFLCHLKFEILG